VNLVFEISEGNAAGIEQINFVGNKYFSSGELRDVISSKIKRWYRFFVNDDVYDSDRMKEDMELLSRFYREHGFAAVEILANVAELSADKKGFILTFTISEGDVYKLGKVDIKSYIKGIDEKELMKDLYCKPGDMYNVVLIDADLSGIVKKVGRGGIASVKVLPKLEIDKKTKTASIVYHVYEGNNVYISKIVIKGNHRTREHVIRREIPLHEGDAMNDTLMSIAENNIRGLGFFKSVNVETIPDVNSPDKCVVQVSVEEQSTGTAIVSGSYSTSSGVGLELSYNERNFFGTGKSFGISVGSSKTRSGKSYVMSADGTTKRVINRKSKFKFFNSVVVNVADPHFLDKDIEGTASAYRYNSDKFDCFSTKELGTTLGISYDLTPSIEQSWDYTICNRKFNDLYILSSPIIKDQIAKKDANGKFDETGHQKSNISSLKHGISYGTSFLTGLKGSFRTGLNTTIAGIGGDAKHLKNELFGTYVMPIWYRATLRFSGTYGLLTKIGGKSPLIADSFSLGLDSFRGFDDCGIGPQSKTTRITSETNKFGNPELVKKDYHDYIGASKYWKGTVEFKFPIGLPEELQFRGFVFSDFGTAWDAPDKGKKLFTEKTDSKGNKIFICNLENTKNTQSSVVDHKILDRKKVRMSVGVGLSFLTPFGPVVFTYAIPIRKEKYDEQQRFLVGFSTTF
jgi:outer membrane protein insertion porin family